MSIQISPLTVIRIMKDNLLDVKNISEFTTLAVIIERNSLSKMEFNVLSDCKGKTESYRIFALHYFITQLV